MPSLQDGARPAARPLREAQTRPMADSLASEGVGWSSGKREMVRGRGGRAACRARGTLQGWGQGGEAAGGRGRGGSLWVPGLLRAQSPQAPGAPSGHQDR